MQSYQLQEMHPSIHTYAALVFGIHVMGTVSELGGIFMYKYANMCKNVHLCAYVGQKCV